MPLVSPDHLDELFMIGGKDTGPTTSVSPKSNLYQPRYEVQIIELTEGPPPPKRPIEDPYWSSSDGSDTSEDEEEEPAGTEYCSSEEDLPEPSAFNNVNPDETSASHAGPLGSHRRRWSDTYPLRAKRILAWREDFFSCLDSLPDPSTLPPAIFSPLLTNLKRKHELDEDDMISQSSKRSRTTLSLSAFTCPACDTPFDSLPALRRHGQGDAPEACSAAVEYRFEDSPPAPRPTPLS